MEVLDSFLGGAKLFPTFLRPNQFGKGLSPLTNVFGKALESTMGCLLTHTFNIHAVGGF